VNEAAAVIQTRANRTPPITTGPVTRHWERRPWPTPDATGVHHAPDRRTAVASIPAGQGRRSRAGVRHGVSFHRCRPQAGTPCAWCGTMFFLRPAPSRVTGSVGPQPTPDATGVHHAPDRRTAVASIPAGQGRRSRAGTREGRGVHRCRPQAGTPCAWSGTMPIARRTPSRVTGSVGPRPTRDEDGERLRTRPPNGRCLHPRRPRPAFPAGARHALLLSSLPAAGRHSMRPARHETVREIHHRPRPAHGASARGRRGTRTAHAHSPNRRTAVAFIRAGQGRRSRAGAWHGLSVHRCRPQAGTASPPNAPRA
jgi:hypothetical protein